MLGFGAFWPRVLRCSDVKVEGFGVIFNLGLPMVFAANVEVHRLFMYMILYVHTTSALDR